MNRPVPALYVRGLQKDVTDGELREKFSSAGPIASVRVCRDEDTLHSLGYGYVKFQHVADAKRALKKFNHDTLKGWCMRVRWARANTFNNVFIKNFGTCMDEEKLKEIFSKFGPILSSSVKMDNDGKSNGFGFVNFKRHEDAQKAVDEMNGKFINERQVFVSRAHNKARLTLRKCVPPQKKQDDRIPSQGKLCRQDVNISKNTLDKSVDAGSCSKSHSYKEQRRVRVTTQHMQKMSSMETETTPTVRTYASVLKSKASTAAVSNIPLSTKAQSMGQPAVAWSKEADPDKVQSTEDSV